MTDTTDQRSVRGHHSDMVARLKKDPSQIELNHDQIDAIHMTLGIAGEAGELVDAIKKWVIYGKDLDRENVIEELGDLEFYLEGLRQRLKIARDVPLGSNLDKLLTGEKARYGRGEYSDEQADARADKQ